MAGTITFEFGDGAFVGVVRFNDALEVNRLTLDNLSGGRGSGMITRTDTGSARPAHELTSPPGSGALFVAVPTAGAQRIQLTERRPGVLDGLEGWFEWEGSGAVARAPGEPIHPPMRVKVTAADGVIRRG